MVDDQQMPSCTTDTQHHSQESWRWSHTCKALFSCIITQVSHFIIKSIHFILRLLNFYWPNMSAVYTWRVRAQPIVLYWFGMYADRQQAEPCTSSKSETPYRNRQGERGRDAPWEGERAENRRERRPHQRDRERGKSEGQTQRWWGRS